MKMFAVSAHDLVLLGIDESVLRTRRKSDLQVGMLLATGGLVFGVFVLRGLVGTVVAVAGVSFAVRSAHRTVSLVKHAAERARNHLELATAVFLELVNVMVAGGAGVETAVKAAAEAGGGPGFSQLRVAIMRAHSSRTSYWESLATLGVETGVDSLVEVAHTMQLAGESGARVRSSLIAKAASLRKKNIARVEHSAEQSTEKMGLPLVVLFLGFLGLVGFPAFSQAMSSL